jgi:hypothetical protein
MTQPIQISIANQSTLFADADLPALANALAIQIKRDVYPAWGVDAQMFYCPTGKNPPASHWVLALIDNADVAGALGYHETTPTGLPLGKAFVATTKAAGDQISVTVSHEIIEMIGDPSINLTAEVDDASGNPSKFYSRELCDAVEDDSCGYDIVIPVGWPGAGTSVLVSDFVLPAWFQPGMPGPYAFKTALTAPFQLAVNGYIGMLDLANLAAGWQQVLPAKASLKTRLAARPHMGSRRMRRALPRSQWMRSTYSPGTEAIAAEAK